MKDESKPDETQGAKGGSAAPDMNTKEKND